MGVKGLGGGSLEASIQAKDNWNSIKARLAEKKRKQRRVLPRFPAWTTRIVDGPELTTKRRK